MQSRLIVKNFGPIIDVDLDLRNVNVFIGPQASGKSALAKLFTIFKAPIRFWDKENYANSIVSFKGLLEEYNIHSFLKIDTIIEFSCNMYNLSYTDGVIQYERIFFNKIEFIENLSINFSNNIENIKAQLLVFCREFKYFEFDLASILNIYDIELGKPIEEYIEFQNINESQVQLAVHYLKTTELVFSTNRTIYIPAERNITSIIKSAAFNLIKNNVPIPMHILSFGAELEKSQNKEIDLTFINPNLVYRNVDGEDRIFFDDNKSIKLIEAASGIQSIVPILIAILSQKGSLPPLKSFVIEEPEMNISPTAQYQLIKKMESLREYPYVEKGGTIHVYTTHSPYVLSALNNLLYANKVINTKGKEIKDKVKKIISTNIHPDSFTAYQIKNGKADSIVNRKTGMITDNYIDDASDEMADDFDALMNLMK